MAFGPPYAYTFIRLVYGQAWAATPAPGVLACYCLYILLLGVNGILEAFQHAVARCVLAVPALVLPGVNTFTCAAAQAFSSKGLASLCCSNAGQR